MANEVVIAAGLSKGQEVVVAGVHTLSPGQKVKREPSRHACRACTGRARSLALTGAAA